MKQVTWDVVYEQIDKEGRYTQQIKWIPPQESGFIVQYVEVDDPLGTIRNYEKPYYEAWKVEDGVVLHEVDGPEEYDDSFSNENDGEFLINREHAKESVQYAMKKAGIKNTSILYNCRICWVDKRSSTYEIINRWEKGYDNGITMARQLRASYNNPGLLAEGRARVFRVDFERNERDYL